MERREILDQVRRSSEHLKNIFGGDIETIISERRYGFISGICKQVVTRPMEERLTTSDRIDRIIINRALGIPIFLFFMWLMFKFTFIVSETPMGWVEAGQEWLGDMVGGLFPEGSILGSLTRKMQFKKANLRN
jgi:ferrous iron transport protein B